MNDAILRKIVNSPNYIQAYNPIREYFESIADSFSGDSQIDRLCSLMKAVEYNDREEPDYYQKRMVRVMKKWLVASVACSLEIHQNEVALGLVQEEEGTGKTSICTWLVPEKLRMMFVKSDKEKNGFNMRKAFTENFIVLFDEFIGLTKFTAEMFKSTMSAKEIDVKDRNDPFPHRKSRIANALFTHNNKTGHNKGFLFPALGTRRFAILHLENIDYDTIMSELDVDKIWAEAYLLLHGGFNYKFVPEDFKEFKEFNLRFMVETSAVQLIESNFSRPVNGSDGTWMTPEDIVIFFKEKRVAGRERLSELLPEKIGVALKQLGFYKKGKRINGIVKYPYNVKHLI